MTKRGLLREMARERQAWERERALFVETFCRLVGQPSQVTDRDQAWLAEADRLRRENEAERRYEYAPEQEA